MIFLHFGHIYDTTCLSHQPGPELLEGDTPKSYPYGTSQPVRLASRTQATCQRWSLYPESLVAVAADPLNFQPVFWGFHVCLQG